MLAKSARKGENGDIPPVSLLDHTRAVYEAVKTILESIPEDCVPDGVDFDRLKRLVLSGAVLHDIGKANNVFQGKICGSIPLDKRQPLRHEGLSALIVSGYVEGSKNFSKKLQNVLLTGWPDQEKNCWMLAWLVGGHHLHLYSSEDKSSGMVRIGGIYDGPIEFMGGSIVDDWCSHFSDILDNAPLALQDFEISTEIGECDDHHAALMDNFYWESEDLSTQLLDEKDYITLAFAKVILIAGDVAGSALWTNDQDDQIDSMKRGMRTALQYHCQESELQKVVRQRLKSDSTDYSEKLYDFQKQVRDAKDSRVILEAACGGGKTIAAYEWARQYVQQGRKLIFCYPTTGTAAAGFDDYLFVQDELERGLISSRASVDIKYMLSNQPSPKGDEEQKNGSNNKLRHPNRDDELENLMKQESLQAWGQQVISATADFVLGLIQNHRRSLFSFPAIVNSAIVFDEIHSYDNKMFGALVRFLKTFPRIPVLMMTASLQPSRRETLEEVGINFKLIGGDSTSEGMERYQLEWYESDKKEKKNKQSGVIPEKYWQSVIEALRDNQKILWVCNTVNDAIAVYNEAMKRIEGNKPILFHSRFCYHHRVARQGNILSRFKESISCLAVTTQVCEMSLDISADLLVTSLPPLPALMQRMGRLNRSCSNPKEPTQANCLVYDYNGMDGRPYRRKDIDDVRVIVRSLAGLGVFSQNLLKEKLNTVEDSESIKFHSAWLDGGWESRQASLREGDANISVLLEQYREEILGDIRKQGKHRKHQVIKEWLVPILSDSKVTRIDEIGGYPLVKLDDGLAYSEEKGVHKEEPSTRNK